MKVFVPLSDDALDAQLLRGVRLVPYRCGYALSPDASGIPTMAAVPPVADEPTPPRDPPISAAA